MKKSYMYHSSTAAKFFNKDLMSGLMNGVKFLACMVLLFPLSSKLQSQGVPQDKAPVPMEELVRKTLKENGQTLRFLENKGQVNNPNVLYYFNGKQGSVYIERNKIRFIAQEYVKMEDESFSFDSLTNALPEVNNVLKSAHTFTLHMDGANPIPNLKLGDSFGTRYNFFQDLNPKNWVSGVHAAKDLTLEEIYPGISLRLYSTKDGALEFDWIMKPGADFEQIKLKFTGQDNLKVDKDGGLTVGLRFSDVKFNIPESYQVTEEGKIPVKMTFKETEDNTITFHTKAKLDARYPLVIDPTLNWGTFMDDDSGTFDEYLYAIQIDTLDGIIYCAGATNKNITVNTNPNDTVSYEADGWRNNITWPTGAGNGGGSNTGEAVAVVYRVNSSGTLLMDLTLYGPSTITNNQEVNAHGLALSPNRVFICGWTEVDLPTAGTPFDNTRSGTDAFVAVFNRALDTLIYATYLGSTGNEIAGATSIRATTDTSFTVGMTANADFPNSGPSYFSPTNVVDSVFGGVSDFYIAKFSGINKLYWGNYVGGADGETFNDLELFPDGNVAFCGSGFSTLTEINSSAGRSNVNTNRDGIIGVFTSDGNTINYLDEIGGAGADRINDVEIISNKLYFTGDVATGFPTSTGAYDVSYNGGVSDAVIGSVPIGGNAPYVATFYGSGGTDLGNGIKLVTSNACDGSGESFLLIWGTVGATGLPTLNQGTEPFYKATYTPGGTSGLDMFFAGFRSTLLVGDLTYGTYVGGNQDDYLGDTGNPRGANHLSVVGSDIFVGTTSHSPNTGGGLVQPVIVPVSGQGHGFDSTKTNTTNDSHVLFSIGVSNIFIEDFSDAPATYGAPKHLIDCDRLRIGLLIDSEVGSVPSIFARTDDTTGLDDEDGVAVPPSFSFGGPQTINVNVDSIRNTTGKVATLYAWIDLSGDGMFQAAEFATTTVANGFTGTKTLTWTNVSVVSNVSQHYMRIRLTTNNLSDNGLTPSVDERSFLSATDGEVEDYRCVEINCPDPSVQPGCLTQAQVDAIYNNWVVRGSGGGGCIGNLSHTNPGPPNKCGGTVTVTYTYTSSCEPLVSTCSSTLTVADSNLVIQCPINKTEAACQTQGAIDTAFNAWLATGIILQGCAPRLITNNNNGAPDKCGGTKTVTFTATASCGTTQTCSATFTVSSSTVVLTCPVNVTKPACYNQMQIDTAFTNWLATVSVTGGCNTLISNNNNGAPLACVGGTKTVTFTVTSSCEANKTCSATFTVPAASSVVLTCATNTTEASCQTQAAIDAKFTTWLATVSASGGCNVAITNNNNGAPDKCGGTKTVTFTATSSCEGNKTCSATFTVTTAPAVVLTCPVNVSEPVCQLQDTINARFNRWLLTATFSGGCNAVLSNNNTGAPDACTGGTATVTFTVTSSCEANKTCSATFAVDGAAPVMLTCPVNATEVVCQTQDSINARFTRWLATATVTGGCNNGLSNNNNGAPDKCGGTKTVVFTVDVTCGSDLTCSATFTVTAAPAVVLTCPVNTTEPLCQRQDSIDARFNRWLATATKTGGCNAVLTNNSTTAPNACTGGTVTVIFTVTSSCEANKTCSAIYSVPGASPIVLTCPSNQTEVPCQTQDSINARFTRWLGTVSTTGGCNVTTTNNNNGAPNRCGGSKTVTFTVTSSCEANKTCSAVFTVTTDTPPIVTGTLDTIFVNGCNISDLPPPVTTVMELEDFGVTITDCTLDNNLIVSSTETNTGSCPIVITRIYNVTDTCNNTSVDIPQIIQIDDTTRPTFTAPIDITIYADSECTYDADTSITGDVSDESDNCSSELEATFADSLVNGACEGSKLIYRKWSLIDSCLNKAPDQTQLITVLDTLIPTFTAPPDITIYKSPDIPDTATIANYDFNKGSSYATLCPILFTDIESEVDNSSNPFLTTIGTASGTLAYSINANAGRALKVVNSASPGFWRFDLKGYSIPKGQQFGVYIQAYRNGTGSATTLDLEYSTDGTSWTNFRSKALTLGAWVQDTATIPNLSSPDSLFIRVAYSGGSGVGTSDLYIDNFQVRSILCCTFEASPSVTGDVTDELDNCSTDLLATFCDSISVEPCDGSNIITRTWSLVDSCGNAAEDQVQIITISDTTRPTFTIPNDTTIYKGSAISDTNTLVNYDFNRGRSYLALAPRLYFGIGSKIDTSSNMFKIDTGTVTGNLAFTNNPIAGRSLCTDSSHLNGHWQFNIGGPTMPLCTNFMVYCQAFMKDTASADTMRFEYSLDNITWVRFDSTMLSHRTWIQDTATVPINVLTDSLYLRITYKGAMGAGPKQLRIDNFQLSAFVNYDSCGYDASPDITGWPTNVMDNCDSLPTLRYTDSITVGSCPDEMIIHRTWTVTDDCDNSNSGVQIIMAVDTTGPIITCPEDVTVTCEESTSADSLGYATAYDNCSDSVAMIVFSDSVVIRTCPVDKLIYRKWTATDSCGNESSCIQLISVEPIPGPFLICPNDTTLSACQAEVDAAFDAWLMTASFSGGCNASMSNNSMGAPSECGGSVTVTFTVDSDCGDPVTCSASFTVTDSPVILTCANDTTVAACLTQSAVDAAFSDWLARTSFTGGCSATLSNNNTGAPPICGGTKTVTFTVTSSCSPVQTCTAAFTVTASPAVVFTCATNKTEAACQTQAAIDASFAAWLLTTTATGGCNGSLTTSPSTPMAPNACGGNTTVTWTYTSSCAPLTTTCSATFTVTASPAVVFTCAVNKTEAACQTQAAIDASFAAWLLTTTATGGCNGALTTSPTTPMAPDKCGGSTTVTWTYTSSCAPTTTTCSATFTVTASPAVVFTCATNKTEAACQTQAAIDASFATWLLTTTATGGCNGLLTTSPATPMAPDKCGGSITVTWTYTSSCAPTTTTCSATFTVTASPAVVFTCAVDKTEAACQTQAAIDASFATWLTTTTATGGCNGLLTTSPTTPMAPDACGGSTTVTWTYTSSCTPMTTTCTATFTVDPSPPVVFTCAVDKTEAACQTQAAIDASFAAWLLTTTATGGCNGMLTTSPTTPMAPDACGGSTTVTWTYTSSCAPTTTSCTATFTVDPSPPVVFTCAVDKTEAACQTQAAIDASFAAWLLTTTATGGCNGMLTTSPTTPMAPDACGGSTTVTWTYTSSCAPTTTSCTATFTVDPSPPVVFTCAVDKTEAACQTQAAIDASFAAWLLTTTATGGCNGALTTSPATPMPPDACGGSTTVTWTYTSSCAPTTTTCTATFTVDPAPPVVLTCAVDKTEAACQTQAAIDASFAAWLLTTTATGGCNGLLTQSPTTPVAPDKCGGSTTVTWTYTSSCTPMTTTCTATFTVDPAPPVVLTCAVDKTEAACQTQAAIDASFATWLTTTTATGGCNGLLTTSPTTPMAPDACGGSTTVTWTYTSSCTPMTTTCTATFTVDPSPPVVFTCAVDKTEAACQTQAAIDASFAAWLLTTTATGGCNGMLTTSPTTPMAPDACGGSTTVTWTYTSSCAPTTTSCTATFTVDPSPPVVFTCAVDKTEAACQTQAAIDASFAAWLLTTTATGGCNGMLTTSPTTPMAPDACGGSTTVTWTYTSSCAPTTTSCTATFTVDPSPPVVFTCAVDKTEAACQTQAAIDASFAAWLLTTTATGGCNGALTTSPATPMPPDACGGSTTVTWTYTSSCAPTTTTCTATFTVDPAPPVVLTCAVDKTEAACQTQAAIDASFAAWLLTTTATGGCNGLLTQSPTTPVAPDKCGGSTTVTWTYTSSCTPMTTTCTATFTVDPAPPVVLTCAVDKTEAACQTQAAIDASFATWLTTATATGGCNGLLTTSPATPMAPDACGGSTTVTWTYTSSCTPMTTTCTATFTVDPSPPVVFTCAVDKTEAACQTQAAIDASFAAWLLTTTATGGCNGMLTTSPTTPMAPDACGGSTTVTWTYTSSCAPTTTSCTATFTVDPSPPVVFTCAVDKTEAACQTQAAIDASFAAWLLTTTATGGCNGMLTTSPTTPMAPDACGGSTTVTWTYTSSCAPTTTSCTATFTVDPSPPVVFTCAVDKTEAACQTQAAIDASFAAWLLTTTATGGCNGALTTSPATPMPPDACGGSTTVTWTYTSSCAPTTTTCTATFTVDPAPPVVLTCAVDKTEAACQTQAAIDASFAAWLLTTTATGGCNGLLTQSPTTPVAPDKCGGSTTVTWTYTSSCTPMTTTCTATFTVDPAPPVVLTCAVDKTEAACQTQAAIDASFATWLTTTTATGGCNGLLTTSPTTPMAPDACGGSTTVTWTYTSSCTPMTTTCTATFTVDPSPPVVFTCAVDKTEAACQTQAAIDASFAAWLLTTTATGGCNGMLTTSPTTPMAPDACGGSTTVTWTYTSSCAPTTTSCTATFTVDPSPPVVFTCAVDKTEAACQTQAAIDASFAAWLLTTTATGGCNGMLTTSPTTPMAPDACGGSTTVTWTYTSSCAPTTTSCTATFTVDPSPPVVFTCAVDKTEAACQTQAAIDASFAAWLLTTTATGGCNGALTTSPATPMPPDACGGSTTVTWTYTSSCAPTTTTCTATFTVDPAPPVVLTCAVDKTEAACQTQAAIDASFAAWLLTTTATGGCNGLLTQSPTTPVAPDKCGGSTTVTWTYTSSCTPMTTTCTATFTVDPAPPVVLTCAVDKTEAACQTQAAIDASFATWLTTTTATGGCNGLLTTSPATPMAPDACGGSTTVTWTYTSSCTPMTTTCTATFTVDPSPPVVFTCAVDKTEAACQTQAAIDASFAAWLLTTTATGGCNGMLTTSPTTPMAPDACGGSTTVTWTYTSSCAPTTTSCTATFTVEPSPPVVFTCAVDKTEAACQTQAAIDASFAAWLLTTTATGGCNGMLTTSPTTPMAPDACGGSTTVTWTYTSSCAPTTTSCTATFTVDPSPPVVFTCAVDKTEAACQTQAAIDASFAAWLLTTTATGGCNGALTTSPATPMPPDACGGSTTVTWTYTSSCAPTTTTCTATFTVDPAPPVVLTCAVDKTEAACQTQAAIDASFAAWLLTTTATGGCNGLLTQSPTTPVAPDKCGGSTTVTWTYTSSCTPMTTTCTATFTVDPAPPVVLTCAVDKTEAACQTQAAIDASFAAWLLTTTATGGCNGLLTQSPVTPVAPDKCGGSTTVTWTYTSSCAPMTTTCTATFTVDPSPPVILTCATSKTEAACQTQSAIDASFAAWLLTTTATGGCNGLLTTSPTTPMPPDKCGGSTTVTWTYTSSCAPTTTSCTATFTVDPSPPVVFTCAVDKTEAACQTQAAIDASFAAWLLTTTATGGCNGLLTTSPTTPMAPDACGGSTTVTWTYTSSCAPTTTSCTATFTVNPSPPVIFTCATSKTEAACQTQAVIDASFAAWLLTTTASGGCNGLLTTSPTTPMAPDACGGSTTVTWTYTTSCTPMTTSCTATFTVDPSPPVVFNCATNKTEAACQTQAAIDASFAAWLLTTTASGGCNGMLTTSPTTPTPPDKCGGVTTVTWTYTSSCAPTSTTCTATFTVDPSPPVVLTCATSKTEAACQTQAAIDASFAAWLLTTTATGGCNGLLTKSPTTPVAPDKCGGSTTVTWTYTSSCAPTTTTCSATFTVTAAPTVVLTCAVNKTEAACQTQAAIDASFAAWLLTTTATGGCNGLLTKSPTNPIAPDKCGGSTTVTWTYTSSCAPTTTTCSATFTVTASPAVVLTCAVNKTEAACQTQAAINASFATWLTTTTATGGCNGLLTTSPITPVAPDKCGGSTTVTWTYTSSCAPTTTTCSATFTVNPSPPVVFTCAVDKTEAACQTQAAINASFAAWLLTTTASGGCNGSLTTSPTTPVAPNACGGSTTVTWTYTSSCAPFTTSCSATFTVTASPPVVFTCAVNKTEAACQTQAVIDASFAAWLLTTTASGGCNGLLTTSPTTPTAPNACGGSTTVTWTYTSSCAPTTTTCSATFTVTASPAVVFTCATNKTEAACQTQAAIDASFAAWLLTTTASGGCNGLLSKSPTTPVAPDKCGGSTTVTWTYTSSCAPTTTTCSATFTVTAAPTVVLTCATNKTEAACQTQAAIDASFAAWLLTTTAMGGCNGLLTTSPTTPMPPDKCGGSTTVTWTYTSSCTPNTTTCSATFTVTASPPVVLTCATNKTEAACQTQAAIDASFAAWLLTTTATGGCNGLLTKSPTTPTAPDKCGGSTTVTWTYTSSCAPTTTTCSATFTVTASPPVNFTCAVNKTEVACQTQAAINASFTAWLATTTATGGCNGVLTTVPASPTAPDKCGGSVTVTWTYTSSCAPTTTTCSATFTVTASPAVVFTCAVNKTEAACQTQAAIDASFAAWLLTTTASGGCNGLLTTSPVTPTAPSRCGGTTTVTWNYTSSCAPTSTTCSATFTVTATSPVVLTCATNKTEVACQSQAVIDASFAAWLLTTTTSGGCNPLLSNNNTGAPSACGGSKTVTFTVTSSCEVDKTCSAVFTVNSSPVVLTCPANATEAACQSQSAIDTKFNTWLTTVTTSGGCNASLSNNNTGAPSACGGVVTVTFTVTSSCEPNKTCTATFTVTSSPVILTCPVNSTEAACQTQAVIDNKFAIWLATVTTSGGCNPSLSNNNTGAPNSCTGGSTTVTFTVTSSCEPNKTCTASFTVSSNPPLIINCPVTTTEAACQTQASINAKFTAWLATATIIGGCNASISNDNTGAPDACTGGTKTVIFTVSSSCQASVTCSASFTVTAAPAVVFTCANNVTEAGCQTQAQIDAKFNTWLATSTASGGCNATVLNNNNGAPSFCGGAKTVLFTVTSSCEPNITCTASFTVSNTTAVALTCPSNKTEGACLSQASIDSSYNAWLLTATTTGGCNPLLTNNSTGAPNSCGGTKTVIFTVTSSCEPNVTCSATFSVTAPPAVVLTCPVSTTVTSCQSQASIDSLFAVWLATATVTGGCNVSLSNNNSGAPPECGGSRVVTFTVTSKCETNKNCTAMFTVSNFPPPVITCPNPITVNCNVSTLPPVTGTATASDACGGIAIITYNDQVNLGDCPGNYTITRTWTATDKCNNFDVCNQLITVIDTTKPSFTLPPNVTLYTGVIPSGVKTIVNYDFNTGSSYNNLRPKLYTGITSKVDTSSNMYMTTTGVISGNLAFTPNTLAGKALKVNDSQQAGIWRFNVGGNNLPLFNNFSVYVQARKNGVGSANTLLMDYSTDGTNWTNFSTTALTTGTWVQCTSPIAGLAFPTQLFVRVRYTGGTNPQTKELYIDNFQIKGTRLADSCAYEDLPSITGYPTNVNHPCDANPIVEYTDSISGGTCINDTKVTRTWYVTDFCGNSSSGTGKQIITVKDTTGPVITCPGNGTTNQRKADTMVCYYTVIGTEFDPFAKDACSDSVTLSNNVNFTSSLNSEQLRVGLHNIIWTATDVCGNVSRCTVVVNVFEREPPVAKCKKITINLDTLGLKTITANDIDNGSTDNCAIKTKTLNRYTYTCDDIPWRIVKLTVTDSSGLMDMCSDTLFVKDVTPPDIKCKDISIILPPSKVKTITADSVLSKIKDNCGILIKTVLPNTFNCASTKSTNVTVTITDVNGNSSTCVAKVTISNDADGDGKYDPCDNCKNVSNPNQEDEDCDGVGNACDVCPKGDDSVDNNNDGLPDCKYPPPFASILASWKCGTKPQKVYIATVDANNVCTRTCVLYTTLTNPMPAKKSLGPCIACGNNLVDGTHQDDIKLSYSDDIHLNEIDATDPDQFIPEKDWDFTIYPNPNSGEFEVYFENPVEEGYLKVYNLLEQEVWSHEITSITSNVKINKSEFKFSAAGIYRVVFMTKEAKKIHTLLLIY